MSLVKYNPFKPFNLDRFFDDLNGRSISDFWGSDFVNIRPSINVIENNDSFDIEVAAPGLEKEDFSIEIDKDRLTISAEKKSATEESDEDNGSFTRREFNYSSFKRSFYLSDEISQDDIAAKYDKGILNIRLAKKEQAKDVKKTISIG